MDNGPYVYYLGGPYSKTKNVEGYQYGYHDAVPGKPFTIIKEDTSDDDFNVAFFLY